MSTKHQLIRIRRGTAAEWSASLPQPGGEVLKLGEPGYEKDTGKLKIGDGTTPWNSLAYFNSGATIDPEELQDLIGDGGFLVSGSGINIDYDDNANTLTISNTKETYDAAVDWTPNHTLVDGTRYLIGDLVYQSGHLYKANYENESMPVSNTTYWTDVGTGYRLNIDGRDIQNIPYPVKDVVAGADISVENTNGIYTISSSSTINTDTLEPDGFVNRTDSEIIFNDGSREFSIGPKFPATNYAIYNNGTKIVKTTVETTTLPDETALYYLHFDKSNNQLLYKTTAFNFNTDIPIAHIYYNADAGKAVYFGEERHGIRMDTATHTYLHNVFGTRYINGLSISNYSTVGDGSNNADATIAIGDGLIYDEDIDAHISHNDSPTSPFEQVLYPIAQIPVYYKNGNDGYWTDTVANDFPVKVDTTIQYNLLDGGSWSASDSTNPNNNRYIAYWICATTQEHAPVISIMGQRIDSNIEQARSNNAWGSLNLNGLPIVELRPLYRLIYDTKNSFTNDAKGFLVDILDIRGHVDTVTGLTQNDHGSLYGLADDDHYQYVHIDNGRTINAVHTFVNGITFGDSTTQLSASPFVPVDSTNLEANINSNSLSVNHGNNYCAILGGNSNTISNSSYYSTIVGGNTNFIGHGTNCAILGGYQNSINDINFTGNILSDCFIYGSNNIIESNSITTNCGILGMWNAIQHGHNSTFIIGHGINLIAMDGSEDRCLFVNSLRIMDNGAGVKFPDGSLQTTAYTGEGGVGIAIWSNSDEYAINDVVLYDNTLYVATNPVGPSSTTPNNDMANWLSLTGPQGDPGVGLNWRGNWESNPSVNYYVVGDAVRGPDNNTYVCIQNTSGQGVQDTNYWQLFMMGFNWRGNYDGGTAYAPYDMVHYFGSSYVCIQSATNVNPYGDGNSTSFWSLVVSVGSPGISIWNNSTVYNPDSLVLYNGGVYQCLQSSMTNTPDSSPEYWLSINTQGPQGPAGSEGPQGNPGISLWDSNVLYEPNALVLYNSLVYMNIGTSMNEAPDTHPEYWQQISTQGPQGDPGLDGLLTDTSSYIICQDGDDFASRYAAAKVLTPGGNALSATNRATLIVMPGNYNLSAELLIDVDFVDILGLGSMKLDRGCVTAVTLLNNTINVTASDIRVKGISVGSNQAFKVGGYNIGYYEDCIGGEQSFGYSNTTAATFVNCVGGDSSFGGGTGSIAGGNYTNCVGGNNSFGGSGSTANGIFIDCVGGDSCFGGYSDGISTGTFTNCRGGSGCFGSGGSGGVTGGFYTNCVGGLDSFGNGSSITGKLISCRLTAGTFDPLLLSGSGKFRLCLNDNYDIINADAP